MACKIYTISKNPRWFSADIANIFENLKESCKDLFMPSLML